jgi:SAM-dependent methyltransferase
MQPQIGHINWLDAISPERCICPVCGSDAPKRLILETPSTTSEFQLLRLVGCTICEARFWTDLTIFVYESDIEYSWSTDFYIEQGASIDSLLEPIARLPTGEIKNCLEIACGYGFSIDAAQVLFGWTVVGVDPSPLARSGAAALGVDIRPIYAHADTELGGPFDLVYGSEVIEHIASPSDFLTICRAHLAPGGILVLTTPDGDSICPDTSQSVLLPVLSPGHHLVLYNAESFERVVRNAGFLWVKVVPREHGLVLYASDRVQSIDLNAPLDRGLFRRYLTSAIARTGLPAQLSFGLKYRLFKELANGALHQEALALFDQIAGDCRRDFGVTLDPPIIDELIGAIRTGSDTGHFTTPFCLPGIFFCRGIIQLNASATPGEAAIWFDAASGTASAFRAAYQKLGIDDGETGVIEQRAAELAIFALCHAEPQSATARLRAMLSPRQIFIKEVVFRLVDLGFTEAARDVAGLYESAALAAFVDGWDGLVTGGRDAETHAAFIAAGAAGGDIALRAWSGDMLILASSQPDEAVALGRELRTSASIDLAPLFMRLVDHGHMVHAAMVAPLVAQQESWRLNAARGILAMLHARQPQNAVLLFRKAFDQARGSASNAELWALRYREALALNAAGDIPAARDVLNEIEAAGDAVSEDVRSGVRKLLRDRMFRRKTS